MFTAFNLFSSICQLNVRNCSDPRTRKISFPVQNILQMERTIGTSCAAPEGIKGPWNLFRCETQTKA